MAEIPKNSDLHSVAQVNAVPVDRVAGTSYGQPRGSTSQNSEPVYGFADRQISQRTSTGDLNQLTRLVDEVFIRAFQNAAERVDDIDVL